MSNAKVVVTSPRKGPKIYNVTLTLSDVVWMCAGLAIALTIFFIFGLLVGRGYVPSEPVAVQAPAAVPAEAQNQTEPAVLKPEDLGYPEKLGEVPPPVVPNAAPAEGTAAKPAAKAEPAKVAPAKPESAKPEVMKTTAPEPGETAYDYTYQVAAFREMGMAEDLSGKLAARGLKTEIKTGEAKGITWYRVRVLFTGTPTQTRPLRETITDVTKIKPVLVGKIEAKRP